MNNETFTAEVEIENLPEDGATDAQKFTTRIWNV